MLGIFNKKKLLDIVRDSIHEVSGKKYKDNTLLSKLHSMNLGAESFGDKTNEVKEVIKKAVINYMA